MKSNYVCKSSNSKYSNNNKINSLNLPTIQHLVHFFYQIQIQTLWKRHKEQIAITITLFSVNILKVSMYVNDKKIYFIND